MTIAQIEARFAEGGMIVDIGQISKEGESWLKKQVRKGTVETFVSYNYPTPKRCYFVSE